MSGTVLSGIKVMPRIRNTFIERDSFNTDSSCRAQSNPAVSQYYENNEKNIINQFFNPSFHVRRSGLSQLSRLLPTSCPGEALRPFLRKTAKKLTTLLIQFFDAKFSTCNRVRMAAGNFVVKKLDVFLLLCNHV
jgi:hypothetical protein